MGKNKKACTTLHKEETKSLREKVADIQAEMKVRLGDKSVPFDEKAFMDEGWEI